MKTRTRAGIALTVGAALALGPSLAASAASSAIANGSFEADAAGSTTITGWTAMNQAIDLGVTSIAGCVTTDTSNYDYLTLRDYGISNEDPWDPYWESVPDFEYAYYVYDSNANDYVRILGDRLVFNDDDESLYLEQGFVPVAAPVSAPDADFGLSSVDSEVADSDASTEAGTDEAGTPPDSEPAPAEPQPTEPEAGEPVTAEPETGDPSGPTEQEPTAPEPTAPVERTEAPVMPAVGPLTYLPRADWSPEQIATFRSALVASQPNPITRGDDLANADLTETAFLVRVVEEGTPGPIDSEGDQENDLEDLGRDGKVLQLYSDMDGDQNGYVVHGPAVYSAPFTVGAGRQISLDWKAVDESDDFHVFGYLLNVDTCAQIEVIDATGLVQDWTTTEVAIPAAGTYRFVFVSGTYDQSWGGAAGAFMYIDNIVQTPVFSSPGIDISLAAGVGDYLPGSDVQVSGGGLTPNAAYNLVLRSTPITVTEGTADGDGKFFEIVTLPLDITPGAHTITLTSGNLSQVVYITVGSDGTLLYVSLNGPEDELAFTGPAEQAGLLALAALLTLTGAAAIELERRRRNPFSTVYVR